MDFYSYNKYKLCISFLVPTTNDMRMKIKDRTVHPVHPFSVIWRNLMVLRSRIYRPWRVMWSSALLTCNKLIICSILHCIWLFFVFCKCYQFHTLSRMLIMRIASNHDNLFLSWNADTIEYLMLARFNTNQMLEYKRHCVAGLLWFLWTLCGRYTSNISMHPFSSNHHCSYK